MDTTTDRAAERLELRWVPVADAAGREHMEACWISVDGSRPAISHAA